MFPVGCLSRQQHNPAWLLRLGAELVMCWARTFCTLSGRHTCVLLCIFTFIVAFSQEILRVRGWEQQYPLFTTVNRIVNDHFPPSDIVNYFEVRGQPQMQLHSEVH